MGSDELIDLNAGLGGVSVLPSSVQSTLMCLPFLTLCGWEGTGPAHRCQALSPSPTTSQPAKSIPLDYRDWPGSNPYCPFSATQSSSVAQSCLIFCDPMDCSMPGLRIHHRLPELAQTHVHRVGDVIQPSHPLSSPSPPTFNLFQHQVLFQ